MFLQVLNSANSRDRLPLHDRFLRTYSLSDVVVVFLVRQWPLRFMDCGDSSHGDDSCDQLTSTFRKKYKMFKMITTCVYLHHKLFGRWDCRLWTSPVVIPLHQAAGNADDISASRSQWCFPFWISIKKTVVQENWRCKHSGHEEKCITTKVCAVNKRSKWKYVAAGKYIGLDCLPARATGIACASHWAARDGFQDSLYVSCRGMTWPTQITKHSMFSVIWANCLLLSPTSWVQMLLALLIECLYMLVV